MLDSIISYSSGSSSLSGGTIFFYLIIAVLMLAAMWKVFTKAGEPGIASIIPIYNTYVLFKIIYGNGIKFLYLFVPILNVVASIMLYVRLGQRFGKGTGFILGMIFLSPIFLLILAFDNSYYQGPDTQSFV